MATEFRAQDVSHYRTWYESMKAELIRVTRELEEKRPWESRAKIYKGLFDDIAVDVQAGDGEAGIR
mgnify:CR=1 FL=1